MLTKNLDTAKERFSLGLAPFMPILSVFWRRYGLSVIGRIDHRREQGLRSVFTLLLFATFLLRAGQFHLHLVANGTPLSEAYGYVDYVLVLALVALGCVESIAVSDTAEAYGNLPQPPDRHSATLAKSVGCLSVFGAVTTLLWLFSIASLLTSGPAAPHLFGALAGPVYLLLLVGTTAELEPELPATESLQRELERARRETAKPPR